MREEPTFSPVGRFGKWTVETMLDVRTMFPKVKRRNPQTGEDEEKSFRVRRRRRTVQLKHDTGAVIQFCSYVHQGQRRYKDSRDKTSRASDAEVVSEMRRLLNIDNLAARDLLKLD